MTDHTPAAQAAMQDPISEAISILTADAASIRESHTPPCDRDDWNSEPETKAYYDRLLRVAGELSKLRAPVADERISLRGAANLAFNALHECKPAKGAEKQYSDAIQALQSALHDIAYTVNRTATPQQFADHLQREARAALASAPVTDGWQPIDTAPAGIRILLGPRDCPVVGVVRITWNPDSMENERSADVVHYNGTRLVAGYHCAEWAALHAAPMPAMMADVTPPATARERWFYDQGRLAECGASAPVAGEAAYYAVMHGQALYGIFDSEAAAVACKGQGHPDAPFSVKPLYAAPQASEAARDAALEEAVHAIWLMRSRPEFEPDEYDKLLDRAMAAIRALKQPQGNKDGGTNA